MAKHAWQGGGPIDLVRDGVVAELKLEKDTPVTLENASRYLARAPHTHPPRNGSCQSSRSST